MKTLLKPLSFIPALLLMYMIFSFSGQAGETSSDLSFRVSCKIVSIGNDIIGTDLTQDRIEHYATKIHGVVRKLAHMTEYFALAVAVAFPLYVYGLRGILLMLVAGAFCVAFACGDEFHQSFVSGRTPSKRDVLIDSIGIFFGILVVRMVGWTGRMTIFRPKEQQPSPQPAQSWKAPPPPYGQPQRRPNPSSFQQTREASPRPPVQEHTSYQSPNQMPPYPNRENQNMQQRPYQQPYVANFDPESLNDGWDENEYNDDDEPISGKPLRLFHYDDEYEEDEVEETKSRSLKSRLSSLKKHNS